MILGLVWCIVFVVALPAFAVGAGLLIRRRFDPELLSRHNDVAGFIYAVIGVVYAVLLGFSAIIVWEQFRGAQHGVDREANALGDLYRNSQVFPPEVRGQIETHLRAYARVVVEKEWPAMAQGQSSLEAWQEYNLLWRTYHEFKPQDDHQRAWYAESIRHLNDLGTQRRDRLLSTHTGVPGMVWAVLLGAGAVTIGFTLFFGTKNAWAQSLMIAGLSLTIGLVLLSIVALEHPFGGITRVEPRSFEQFQDIIERWGRSGAVRGP